MLLIAMMPLSSTTGLLSIYLVSSIPAGPVRARDSNDWIAGNPTPPHSGVEKAYIIQIHGENKTNQTLCLQSLEL